MTSLRSPLRFFLLWCCVLFFLGNGSVFAATPVTCTEPLRANPQPVEYFVSLAAPANHIAHVSIRLLEGEGRRTLAMPVWNALYQVRNFATNIEDVRAKDSSGKELQVRNPSPSEWMIEAPRGCIVVSYDVHLESPGPFGSVLDADHGFFNWAMVLMYSPALRSQPVSLQLQDVPATWALRDLHVFGGADPGKVDDVMGMARNYDELVDSPADLGTFQQSSFQQDGATYHVVVDGNPADYDMTKLEAILEKITHAAVGWMQDRPFDQYTFLYQFLHGRGGGGMEHAYGTAIAMDGARVKDSLLPVAGVSAHEFFHLWNVKRIRPQSLEPIDYQHPQDTRMLWFCEGFTSTVGDMLLARSGLMDEKEYLQRVSREITELEGRPARLWQSVEESSVNAWFEGNAFYRSPMRSISYYNKGEIVGILLDLRIRQLTNDRKSLRDLFQWMNEHYAKKGLFFPDLTGIEQAAEAITGQNLDDFFHEYVSGTVEIPYDHFLAFAGLRMTLQTTQVGAAGFTTTANLGGPPEVVQVEPGSEAQKAGVAVGDRVVTIDGRATDAFLDDEIAQMKPETTVHFTLENRRGRRDVKFRLGSRLQQFFELQDLPSVTDEQRAHRKAWIHGDDEMSQVARLQREPGTRHKFSQLAQQRREPERETKAGAAR